MVEHHNNNPGVPPINPYMPYPPIMVQPQVQPHMQQQQIPQMQPPPYPGNIPIGLHNLEELTQDKENLIRYLQLHCHVHHQPYGVELRMEVLAIAWKHKAERFIRDECLTCYPSTTRPYIQNVVTAAEIFLCPPSILFPIPQSYLLLTMSATPIQFQHSRKDGSFIYARAAGTNIAYALGHKFTRPPLAHSKVAIYTWSQTSPAFIGRLNRIIKHWEDCVDIEVLPLLHHPSRARFILRVPSYCIQFQPQSPYHILLVPQYQYSPSSSPYYNIKTPHLEELLAHEELIDSFFSYLQNQLDTHCRIHHDPRSPLAEYQAGVAISLVGPNMGKLIIHWNCNQYMAILQPPADPEDQVPISSRMTDPFSYPFRPITRETILSIMDALTLLREGMHPDQNIPHEDASTTTVIEQHQEEEEAS
ncbi:hypothetical protein L210DRAFT_3506446 [Boletus edulis BED1]|uniref:Uncharacterized protein n=1 Tax=Boletus edulis BED1 TaxID=1328754 RepID=A0AAD4BMF1_BOLED|nr:hypothetical protein L210DRAFT_3506446 [Boletus edulis BED1]